MKTPLRLAIATLALALAPLAHARPTLVASFPDKGQALAGPPAEIHLTFSEHVDPRGCHVKLVNGAGKRFDADRAHADKASPNTLVATVPVLRPGAYSVRWVAVGADGHKLHGDFAFTVK